MDVTGKLHRVYHGLSFLAERFSSVIPNRCTDVLRYAALLIEAGRSADVGTGYQVGNGESFQYQTDKYLLGGDFDSYRVEFKAYLMDRED